MTKVGETLRLLKDRGFVPIAARVGQRSFQGQLPCQKGPVRVQITIEDWNFLEYPTIHLEERASFLPTLMPHVDVLGNLCYFAHGSITLDRYDPATAIAQCLNQATALLDRISMDPGYRDTDIQNEFLAHWEYGQTTLPWEVLLGDIAPGEKSTNFFIIKLDSKEHALIATDAYEADRLAKTLGAKEIVRGNRCWLLHSKVLPAVPEKMPKTVKELFIWLAQWDKDLASGLQQLLATPDYLRSKFFFCAVETPIGWLGFGFDLVQPQRQIYKNKPKHYRNYLHNKGGGQLLSRLSINEVGSRFVHSRNLTFPDLHNKRITVVGCGAVGSFVAQSLIRLGAGTGNLGLLKLIDPDILNSGNLGRHVLGYPSLLRQKSIALTEELVRLFPHSRVEAVTSSVVNHKALFAAELIVDATGEETVSEFLNGLRLQRASRVPILHVWVRGNGEAVQALWADLDGSGCYRCLLVPDETYHRKERFRLLKTKPARHQIGCHAATPYAVSAPMHAAALATDMVCAWLQGSPSPRFRTRCVETADLFSVKNQDISKMNGCPACGHL